MVLNGTRMGLNLFNSFNRNSSVRTLYTKETVQYCRADLEFQIDLRNQNSNHARRL